MKNISVGTHKLKLDFANGASGVLFSTQADSGRTFEVQVLDEENNVQDITGLTLDFFVGTAKEVTKVSATIKDAVNGIFEINAVSSQFKYAGVHKAQFVLRDATGAKIGTQIYNIHVEESIENGATVGENVIVSFEAVSEAAELLRNSGAVLEESKEVSATLKTDITKAETIDTTLKTTTKTAEDTNTKAQATNTTLTKAIETANTANANTTNTLNQLTAENDEATLNIADLDEKNNQAKTNISNLTKTTDTANTADTNLKQTITNAAAAEETLKTEIVNAGLENYLTIEDIKNKADLDETGKVPVDQLPKIDTFPSGGTTGQVLKLNSSGQVVWGNDSDTKYSHPSTHSANMIVETTDKKFVSQVEKTTWGNKQDALSNATQTEDGIMSSIDKTKLDGVETGAQKNIMTSGDKAKLDGIEANAQKNTVTSVQGRTGAVTISKTDVGLGRVENIGIKILTQVQYDVLSPTEKSRADVVYLVNG